jgi:two-component sensor histidine kinase
MDCFVKNNEKGLFLKIKSTADLPLPQGFSISNLEKIRMRIKILFPFLILSLCLLVKSQLIGQTVAEPNNVSYIEALAKLGITNVDNDFSNNKTLFIIRVWDSLNRNHHNTIYDKLPAKEWQRILEKRYNLAIQNKDDAMRFKIALPLSFICHTRSAFLEGLPVLQYLYANKSKLNRSAYESVLIKLEEEYRFFNQMAQVLNIRNERIENGFIKTFWEIYSSCGLYDEAINDYKLFEPFPKEYSRKRLAYFLRLGDLFFEAKKIDSAEKYFRIGLQEAEVFIKLIETRKVNEEGDFIYWRGWFNGLIANCLIERGDYAQAKKLLIFYLSLSKGEYRLNSLFPLSVCYINTGELKKAKLCLDSVAYYIAGRTIGKLEVKYFKISSDYYHAIGKNDSAFYYLQKYNRFNEAATAGVLKNQSSLLTGKMELEKRRKELVLTQNELVETKLSSSIQEGQLYLSVAGLVSFLIIILLVLRNLRQNEKSKQLIEAKNSLLEIYAENNLQKSQYNEQLIKELHHRVKNNLQNVYSLLNIQKRRIEDRETIEFVNSIQNRINSMAIVHESLYAESDIELIDFKAYTIKLVDHLYHSFQKEGQAVEVNYEIDSAQISLEKIILLGLIINETVSNVFKHATDKAKQTTLTIQLLVKNQDCTLIITDNGPGFEMNAVSEKSLGLKLIQTMCQQLEAEYILAHQDGVTHKITFSI